LLDLGSGGRRQCFERAGPLQERDLIPRVLAKLAQSAEHRRPIAGIAGLVVGPKQFRTNMGVVE
jgi:hypothetical protein